MATHGHDGPTAKGIAAGVRAALVGDRTGLALCLGSLLLFGLTWRVGVFVSDTYTLANALVGVADGHLYVDRTPFGPTADTPGTHLVDGRVYGRNYGQVVLAVPLLWALRAATWVLDLSIVLPLVWSGLLFAFAATVGERLDRREATPVGAVLALLLFGANAAMARPIDPALLPVVALQLSAMIAAAFVAVFVYRLLARMHDRRVGAFAGTAVAVATPVGFWATIPKRHSLAALFVVLALYCFYRSRDAPTARRATAFRALTYVPVGIATWVHAPEGFVLFVALGSVDVVTARSNHPRRLAVVAAVFLLSLLPFLLTNALISGNPVEPPRTLPPFDGASIPTDPGGPAGNGSVGSGPPPGGDPAGSADGWFGLLASVLATVAVLLGDFAGYVWESVAAVLDAGRLFDVFVRSDHGLGLHRFGTQSVNLAVLEAMPLAAALLATPVVLYDRVKRRGARLELPTGPERATDALAVAYLVLLVIVSVPRLPIHASFTVRYLHPLYPLAVYFLARLGVVRRVVRTDARPLTAAYAGFVLVGAATFALVVATVAGEVDEAVQFHARLALAAAAIVLYWAVVATLTDGAERLGALSLAFAGAAATTFLLLAALWYFPYGTGFALPVSRVLAEFAPF